MGKLTAPTSFGQQRLWFLDQVTPGSAAYNLARAFHLTGSLNQTALARSFEAVISRHESLRTIFVSEDGEVKQLVLTHMNFHLPVVEMNDLLADHSERASLCIAGEEARQAFDLGRGPLLRAKLIRAAPEDHILVLVIHHIITDGWSMNLLFHEISKLYTSFVTGKEPKLSKLNLQYSDYSRWQRSTIKGAFLDGEIGFWKDVLQGAETVLQLPTDRPRPPVHSGRGNSIHFDLSPETNKSLKALAHSENATLFMAILAVFQVLLGRYASQDSVLIGSPTAGRNEVELEHLIGFFVNTLIIRADLDPKSSFRQILQQARANTLEALTHQHVPFEKLVEALEPDRSLNRNPLFQVMFVLQSAPRQIIELPGLTIEELEFESGIAKFDLNLEVIDFGNLHCTFEYDSDIFDKDTIQRMSGHFAKLVEVVIAAPDQPLSSLSFLTEVEVSQLAEWNNTDSEYPRELCVHTAFEEQVMLTPDRTAVFGEKRRLSYRELNELSNKLARLLIQQGVRPDSVVGVSLNRSTEMFVALVAILKTGAAYLTLDPAYPDGRLDFMIEDSQAYLVATAPEFADRWRQRKIESLVFEIEALCAEELDSLNLSLPLRADRRMYIIYTSGSTGSPKGIAGSHRASMNRFSWMWNRYPFSESDICCQKTFLGFVDSVWEIFGPLLKGIPSVILPDDALVDVKRLVQLLSTHEVTRLVLVPSLLQAILESVKDIQSRLPKLLLWTCSGETLSSELAVRFSQMLPSARLLNIYGSSEVAADVTCHEVTSADMNGPIAIGRPISNVQVYIFDRHLNLAPIGVQGELYVGGDCLAEGYFRKPELTAERFITHDFGTGRTVRLFKTGDLGRYFASGDIEYFGRVDNQVKIRGVRVELGEIEEVLKSLPEILNAVVMVNDRLGRKGLTAYLVIRSGAHPDIEQIRSFMRSKLPLVMIPSDYLIVNFLPLLPSGKVDRMALSSQNSIRLTAGHGYCTDKK